MSENIFKMKGNMKMKVCMHAYRCNTYTYTKNERNSKNVSMPTKLQFLENLCNIIYSKIDFSTPILLKNIGLPRQSFCTVLLQLLRTVLSKKKGMSEKSKQL